VKYTLAQLQSLAASAGFPDPSLAAAVAMAESCGNPCAQGDPNIGGTPCNEGDPAHSCAEPNGAATSFGLWQVHVTAHPEYDPARLLDAAYNARAAYAISHGGADWTPWSTYTNGAYAKYVAPFSPSPLPVMLPPAPVILAPVRHKAPVVFIVVGALALAAAAGYAAQESRRRGFA
jgi:hypothetical protein